MKFPIYLGQLVYYTLCMLRITEYQVRLLSIFRQLLYSDLIRPNPIDPLFATALSARLWILML